MALTLSVGPNKERRLWWKTEIPYNECTRKSPAFWFQNKKVYFELKLIKNSELNGSYTYDIFIQNGEFESFNFSSYIEIEKYKQICLQSRLVSSSTDYAAFFKLTEIGASINLQCIGTLNFVFVFGDDYGQSIHLADEKDMTSTSTQVDLPVDWIAEDTEKSQSCLESLLLDFSKLLDEGLYHDVELKCGDDIFKAHRNVLSTRSKVFSAMLQSDMVEGQTGQVTIPDMEADVFKQFLRYIYTGEMSQMTFDIAKYFYEIGDKFAVDGLMKKSSEFLTDNLTPENACDMLILADAHSDRRFKKCVIAYIIDKNIHLQDDPWLAFSDYHPKLACEVLNRLVRMKTIMSDF